MRWDSPFVLATAGTLAVHLALITAGDAFVAYNPPKIIEAVKEAGKQGKIQVIGFDEDAETLQGIIDGHVHGTVVQDPYQYGYQSVRILAALARGDKSVLPENGFLNVPAQTITKENVVEFRKRLHELTGVATN